MSDDTIKFSYWWSCFTAIRRVRGNTVPVPELSARYLHGLGFSPSDAATIIEERGADSVLADAKRKAQ